MQIVTRSQWKAKKATSETMRSLNQIQGVCYHHTDGPKPSVLRPAARLVRDIQAYHMSIGYSDIAYNVLVDRQGRAFAGRPIEVYGAHSSGVDPVSGAPANRVLLSVAFLGNYDEYDLSIAQKQSALTLEYLWSLKLGRSLTRCAHRDTKPTACPGRFVAAWLRGM